MKIQKAMSTAEVGAIDPVVLSESLFENANASQQGHGTIHLPTNRRSKIAGLSSGGTSYRDPIAIQLGPANNPPSAAIASDALDMAADHGCGHGVSEATSAARAAITASHFDRRCPYDELGVLLPESEPAAEILYFFGNSADVVEVAPWMRF